MKRLIVNADDFGLTEGVNRGIIQAFREGILTSATLMANAPAFEDAVARAKEHQNFGSGLPFGADRRARGGIARRNWKSGG